MEGSSSVDCIKKRSLYEPSIGERRRFVNAWILAELGYVQEFLYYADTEWEVIKITPAWRSDCLQYYFDLQNDQGVVISSIADEVLIKIG